VGEEGFKSNHLQHGSRAGEAGFVIVGRRRSFMGDESSLNQAIPVNAAAMVDGLEYFLHVRRPVRLSPDAPRLIVVANQQNRTASGLLRVCIEAIRQFTPEPHEVWVVDNNSPVEKLGWLIEQPDVNAIFSRTEPIPPQARRAQTSPVRENAQEDRGSYANAVGLELGIRTIDPASRHIMALHMDTLPCKGGWLSFLISKLSGSVAAAGVRLDRTRIPEGVLHVLGFVVDFQLFVRLGLDFFPRPPLLDVGDRITTEFRSAGYEVFSCRNTMWEPQLSDRLRPDSPLRRLPVDRAFDDDGRAIFLHLGRGVRKATGKHIKGLSAQDWIRFADREILGGSWDPEKNRLLNGE